jgi:hypothetical protein
MEILERLEMDVMVVPDLLLKKETGQLKLFSASISRTETEFLVLVPRTVAERKYQHLLDKLALELRSPQRSNLEHSTTLSLALTAEFNSVNLFNSLPGGHNLFNSLNGGHNLYNSPPGGHRLSSHLPNLTR